MTFISRELRNKLRRYYTGQGVEQNPHGPQIILDSLYDSPGYRHPIVVGLLDMVEELLDVIGKQQVERPGDKQ